jgi:class 3 adenylate cyclase
MTQIARIKSPGSGYSSKRRFLPTVTFRRKLQVLLVLLVGVSCGLLVFLSLRKANRLAFELIQEKVFTLVASTAPRIDGDKVARLVSAEQDGSELYEEVASPLREVLAANDAGALPVRFLYVVRPLEGGAWEYVVDAETDPEQRSALGDLVEFHHSREVPVLGEARVDERFAKDSFGTWLSAFAPILDGEGRPVAMLGADIASQRIETLLRRLLVGDLIAMLVALSLAAALAAWLSARVTRPLTELQEFVRGIGRGDLSSRIRLERADEFGELADAINQMAEGLEERESLKGALVHYVRSQAADAKLGGDEVVAPRRVTVLVAELCGFGQLSSRLGGERVFALLNEYFSTMIDIVLRHQGSLEKSTDESVIAVFGASHDDPHQERLAIQAALAMQNALERLLHAWRVETNLPIFLEIGIHSDAARVRRGGAGDALDFESVRGVIETASRVREAGRRMKNRLTVSGATTASVEHTFPLTEVSEEGGDLALFRVEMPRPSVV